MDRETVATAAMAPSIITVAAPMAIPTVPDRSIQRLPEVVLNRLASDALRRPPVLQTSHPPDQFLPAVRLVPPTLPPSALGLIRR